MLGRGEELGTVYSVHAAAEERAFFRGTERALGQSRLSPILRALSCWSDRAPAEDDCGHWGFAAVKKSGRRISGLRRFCSSYIESVKCFCLSSWMIASWTLERGCTVFSLILMM
jgi:hypothetical protein